MDNFNYLAVLISIILGLGMTQLLSGFGRWVESRFAFPSYTPTIIWVAALLVMHVQTWWSMYGMRHHANWTFVQFLVVLLQPIILFLLATVVLPSPAAAVLDLKSNYFNKRRWFFGLLIALLIASVCRDMVITGSLPSSLNLLFHALFLLAALVGLISTRELHHQILALSSASLIAVYIALLYSDLQ